MKIRITVAGLAIAALALTGCTATKAAEPAANNSSNAPAATQAPAQTSAPAIGVPVDVKQNDGVAKVTIESATYGTGTGNTYDIPAKNGGYLILDVLWEAESGTANSNPLYITAKDSNGVAGGIALQVPTPLTSGDVPVGDKSRGNVGFDIGPGPYTIVITNQLLQESVRLSGVIATPR